MRKIKFYLLFLIVSCFYACESGMNSEMQFEESLNLHEMTIYDASINEVLSFVKNIYPEKYEYLCLTKNDLELEFVTNLTYETTKFLAPAIGDSTIDASIDTLLSIVNFGDEEGFAIVSVHDNRILAVTEKGNLSINDLTKDYTEREFESNPNAVISAYVSNYVLGGIPINPTPLDSMYLGYVYKSGWLTEMQIDPLVQMKLHQKEPYNMYCLDSLNRLLPAGCATIAIIQMMSVNKYPNTIGGRTANWNTIISQYQTVALTKRILAEWIRTIGEECAIDYYSGKKASSLNDMKKCISSYARYTNVNHIISPNYNDVYLMLENEKPLVFVGYRLNNKGLEAAHAWVVDGCLYQKQITKIYNPNRELINQYEEYRDYVHCNWGWGGDCDGYYETSVFDLNNGAVIPDEGTSGTTKTFYYNLGIDAIIYNFE